MNDWKTRKLLTKGRLLAIIVVTVFFIQLGGLPGNAAINVAIFPLETNGSKEIAYLKDGVWEIISSRIGLPGKVYVLGQNQIKEALENKNAELDAEAIQSIGYQLDADYIIVGSLSKEGETITVEGKIVSLKNTVSPLLFSKECKKINDVIPSVSELAEEMRKKIVYLHKKDSTPLTDLPDNEMQSLQEEKIFPGEPAGRISSERIAMESGALGSQPRSPEIFPQKQLQESGKISLNYWRSNKISYDIKGLAIGDADGDGHKEIVLVSDSKILVYRKKEEQLHKLAEYKGEGSAHFLKIDMIDGNGNGVEEIFVTNRQDNVLSSIVVEYRNENMEKIVDSRKWLFGVVNFPGEGPILLGQDYGGNNTFNGQIYRMKWDLGGYVRSEPAEIPLGLPMFGLGVLGGEDSKEKEFIHLGYDGRLSILGHNGEAKWESERTYGGSDIGFQLASNNSSGVNEETVFFPMRLFIKDLNNDRKEDIILGKNFPKDKGLIRRKSGYESSSVYDLQWNGNDMDLRWQTEKLDECIVDYSIADADNDGRDELVIAVRGGRSRLTFRPKNYILIYEISWKI